MNEKDWQGKKIFTGVFLFLISTCPLIGNAQSTVPAGSDGLQILLIDAVLFINNTLIPFLFALGLLFFIYNAFRFFILKGSDPRGREQAKSLALYGVLGFVFLVSIWGIVNMIVVSLDLQNNAPLNSDYIETYSNYNQSIP